jgi:putative Holliday junction resolvase
MTARAERFARQLEGRFGRSVRRVDERYSSVEADDNVRTHGASGASRGPTRNAALAAAARGTTRNDAVAASLILRQYLNAITRSPDDDRA